MFLSATVALGLFASPLAAQQTAPAQSVPPDQQSQPSVPPAPPPDQQSPPSVPPAPPPDMQAAPGGPPPFPPMPSRAPRHRWVDMGGHPRATRTHQSARHSQHKSSHKAKPARHRLSRTEKDIRYCDGLSHRKAMHNRKCVALMKKQKASRAHHRLTRAEKNARYCDSLSHRKMTHNRTCVALMKKQKATHRRVTTHRHRTSRHAVRHRR
jgi:hypothetical protein